MRALKSFITGPKHDILSPCPLEEVRLEQAISYGLPADSSTIAYDAIQKLLAVGSQHGEIKVLGRAGVEQLLAYGLDGPRPGAVNMLEFAPNMHTLLSVHDGGAIVVWDLAARRASARLDATGVVTSVHVPIRSPFAYVGTAAGLVLIVDLFPTDGGLARFAPYTLGHELAAPGARGRAGVSALAASPLRDEVLLVAFTDGCVVLFHLLRRELIRSFALLDGAASAEHAEPIPTSVSWHSSGRQFVVGYADGRLVVWAEEAADAPTLTLSAAPATGGLCRPIRAVCWGNAPAGGGVDGSAVPALFMLGGTLLEEEPDAVVVLRGETWAERLIFSGGVARAGGTVAAVRSFALAGGGLLLNGGVHRPVNLIALSARGGLRLFSLTHSGVAPLAWPSAFDVPPRISALYRLAGRDARMRKALRPAANPFGPWPMRAGELRAVQAEQIVACAHEDGSLRLFDMATRGALPLRACEALAADGARVERQPPGCAVLVLHAFGPGHFAPGHSAPGHSAPGLLVAGYEDGRVETLWLTLPETRADAAARSRRVSATAAPAAAPAAVSSPAPVTPPPSPPAPASPLAESAPPAAESEEAAVDAPDTLVHAPVDGAPSAAPEPPLAEAAAAAPGQAHAAAPGGDGDAAATGDDGDGSAAADSPGADEAALPALPPPPPPPPTPPAEAEADAAPLAASAAPSAAAAETLVGAMGATTSRRGSAAVEAATAPAACAYVSATPPELAECHPGRITAVLALPLAPAAGGADDARATAGADGGAAHVVLLVGDGCGTLSRTVLVARPGQPPLVLSHAVAHLASLCDDAQVVSLSALAGASLVFVGLLSGAVAALSLETLAVVGVYAPKQHAQLRTAAIVRLAPCAADASTAESAEAEGGDDGKPAQPAPPAQAAKRAEAAAAVDVLVHVSERKVALLHPTTHALLAEHALPTPIVAACVFELRGATVVGTLTAADELRCVGLPDLRVLLVAQLSLGAVCSAHAQRVRALAGGADAPAGPTLCWSSDGALTAALSGGEVVVLTLGAGGSDEPARGQGWAEALCRGADISLITPGVAMPNRPQTMASAVDVGLQSVGKLTSSLVGWLSRKASVVDGDAASAEDAAPEVALPTCVAEAFRGAETTARPPPRAAAAPAREANLRSELFGRAAAAVSRAAGSAAAAVERRGSGTPALAGELESTRSGMHEGVEALHERGAKLGNLADRAEQLATESEDFFAAARKLRQKQESQNKLFGFF